MLACLERPPGAATAAGSALLLQIPQGGRSPCPPWHKRQHLGGTKHLADPSVPCEPSSPRPPHPQQDGSSDIPVRSPQRFDPLRGETGRFIYPQLGLAQRPFLGCGLFAATSVNVRGSQKMPPACGTRAPLKRAGSRDWGKLKLRYNHSINVRNLLKKSCH